MLRHSREMHQRPRRVEERVLLEMLLVIKYLVPYLFLTLRAFIDMAILRLCDTLTSAETIRNTWINVFRKSFNSKTKYMLQLSKFSSETRLDDESPISP